MATLWLPRPGQTRPLAKRNPRPPPKRCATSARSGSTSSALVRPTIPTDSFIELYNPGTREVDLSNWTLTQHSSLQAIFSSIRIPPATKLAAHGFYLLGLSGSGLAVAARAGDARLSTSEAQPAFRPGIRLALDGETRKVLSVGTAAGTSTTLWQPLPGGSGDDRSFRFHQPACDQARPVLQSVRRSRSVTAPPIPRLRERA